MSTHMQTEDTEIRHHVPIAICGYSYRLPGGLTNDQSFWDLLTSRGYVQEPIADRYGEGVAQYDGFADSPLSFASLFEGLIRDGRELEFDCALFGISVHDAKRMDPQIKMMLTATWEALQCAGMDQASLHNSRTGVFTGIQTSSIAGWRPLYGAKPGDVPGKSGSMIANRISFHFNWMGPSFSVATACSSGITALDAAVKSLDVGECNLAAFGAVHYLGHAQSSIGFNALGIISKTGTSRSFDKDANGYMRSEGAFVYILKRLADAERDGDRIFGVIRGCALNTAGAEENAEILTQGRMIVAPVMHAQQKLMAQIVTQVGVDPLTVDYIEAHATGTVLGDAIEGNAIANVYGSADRETPLRIASVRSNIGHMEAASFTCSLLKVLLMLQRRKFLPISSHHKEVTDKIPFAEKNMRVLTEVEPFPDNKVVRIGINSFGFGGANGHCLLEEYSMPGKDAWSKLPGKLDNKVYMVPLSAKSDEALVDNARRLAESIDILAENDEVDLYTLVGNLSVRMTHHRVRTALSASTLNDLKEKLAAFVERSDLEELKDNEISRVNLPRSNDPKAKEGEKILFLFPGQGSQWAGCGRELYETEIVFRRVVDAIDEEWIKLAGQKLSDVAFDENLSDKLNECCWAQPVTFMLQVAMYELFVSHGIYPRAVLGHSAGEPAAAYASGAYTLEEACYLVFHRARLQHSLAGCGRMLVLMLDGSSAQDIIHRYDVSDAVEIACFNSVNNTVVCGAEDIILGLQKKLEADGQPNGTLIPGNIAFHSQYMTPIKDELLESLKVLDRPAPRCSKTPMISTVTGHHIKAFDAEYWWNNVRQPVDLISAITTSDSNVQPHVIIELSPHITLRSSVRDYYNDTGIPMPTYIHTLVRKSNTADLFAQSIGNCFKAGLPVTFIKLYPRPCPVTHLLPHYAMKRERVIDDNLDDKALIKKELRNTGPMIGSYTSSDHLSFENVFSKQHFSWMVDHVVQGQPLVPAAAYIEIIFEAFRGKIVHIISARCLAPFLLTNDPAMIYTDLFPCPYAPHRYEFKIFSRLVGNHSLESKLHCMGVVEVITENQIQWVISDDIPRNIADIRDDNNYELVYKDSSDFYTTMSARIGQNFSYGPYFQGVSKVEYDKTNHRIRYDVKIDPDLWKKWDMMGYLFHPSMLDGALQSFLVYLLDASDFSGVPQMVKNMVFLNKPSSEHIVVVYEPPDYLKKGNFHQKGQLAIALGERSAGHCWVYDGVTGDLICVLGDYTSYSSNTKISELRKIKHYLSWQPKDVVEADAAIHRTVSLLNEGSEFGALVKLLISDITSMAHPEPDTPFFLNVAECVIGAVPARLAMEDCISVITNAPVQYTIVSDDTKFLTDSYQKLGANNADAHLRFASIEDDALKGFLRRGMCELLVIRVNLECDDTGDGDDYRSVHDEYERVATLSSPGGVVLVESKGKQMPSPFDWTCIWESATSSSATTCKLFTTPCISSTKVKVEGVDSSNASQAPTSTSDSITSSQSSATTWLSIVVNDSLGYSDYFTSNIRRNSSADLDFEQACLWERVDYFAMHGNEDTAEFFDGPSKLTDFVKEISIRRASSQDVLPCLFTVYTSGAMRNVSRPSQTGIWGAVRSLALELGDSCSIDFRLLDVATSEDLRLATDCENMRERELCIHNGRIWSCRLINIRETMPMINVETDINDSFRLHTNNSGLLADLEFRLDELPSLKADQVEIAVKAAALNFRDIMVGLGKLPLLSYEASMLGRTIGMECAGVVLRCGCDVKDLKVGDRVLAVDGGCVANRIVCHQMAAFKMPDNLTFEEGSAIPSVYNTAYYSLVYIAGVKKGQTVLIHSALGGVGLAAIAIAKLYELEIYGTAGTEEKRQTLRDMGCKDAFDSHSTSWLSDLMQSTKGCGVDVVINSLAGEHVDLCLEALKPGGYHCEIGKVDIYADRPMKLAIFRKNLRFCAIDMDRLMHDDPLLVRKLISEFLKLIEDGKLPALPCTTYSYNHYQDALRCMMNGQHRGKLVLTPPAQGETISVVDNRTLFGRSKAGSPRTVLMSGCLGGFGLRVLAYVVALGARHVLLLDRDKERKRDVQWVLENSYISFLLGKVEGLRVEIIYSDVGIYEDVVDAVASVKRLGLPPIGSVFHLAGILDDRKVEEMDRNSFAKVYQPKAKGAWNLHCATESCETIDHFVMVSSTSSVFGNPGQVNYSAANSFQDGLAAFRLQSGKPALSFCMGAVIEAGMASRSPQLLQLMKAGGMPAISCLFAIEALDAAIRGRAHWNFVAVMTKDLSANFDSPDFLRTVAQLIRNNSAFKIGDSSNLSREALIEVLSERVGKLCGVEKLDPTEPFSSYGLNSISVAELAAYLKNEMGYTVSAMELMTSATCESIADGIIQASSSSTHHCEDKRDDEGTAETGADTDSATGSSADDGIWSEPVVRHPSLFEPEIHEYFAHPPLRQTKESGKHDMVSTFLKLDSGKVENEANSASDPLDNLGMLDDKLPPPCQNVLNKLNAFVDSINVSDVAKSVPLKDIKCVLLTGVTGFVGRHFVADLLNYSETYIQKIYCPVRASSDVMAMERLVEAMSEAGTWDDKFASRLHVFRGDLNDVHLGVLPELLQELNENVDAVFHIAANIALTAHWNDASSDNCIPMQAILKLCLSVRRKHLYLVSTLGIFPQYFCQFSNEMTDKAILRDAMPSISLMKRIFPLSIGGYAWSKLVNELASLKARKTKDLDVAVFRLPVMSTNSRTGYSVNGDPWVRIFFATLQLRLLPGNGRPRIMEDSALSNEMMLRISLNPNRKNIIYNLSYQSHTFDTEAPLSDYMGFPAQLTSYEHFKSQCLKLGSDSPVNAYWTLLDTFVSYWVNFKRYAVEYPIDISTIEEDCIPLPEKTNSLEVLCKSMEWASTQKVQSLNISLLEPSTDLESVLLPARKVCSKYGLDFGTIVKPFVIEGLSRICDEVHTRKSLLPEVAYSLTMRLEARIHLHRLLQLHPEIYDERISAPIFILGLDRTGTTGLHRLLEASGLFEAPHPEDQFAIPRPEQIEFPDEKFAKKRLAAIASYLRSSVGSVAGGFDVAVGLAEEDVIAHTCSFMSPEYDILYDLPKYRAWLENQGLDEVYKEHRIWMQFIAWWRRRQNPDNVSRWCYKMPWHLRSLKQLLVVYPDAKFVHIHRDIRDVAGLWFSLVNSQRSRFIEDVNLKQIGTVELKSLEATLTAALQFRTNHPEIKDKFLDINYTQLIKSSLDEAKKVLRHANVKPDNHAIDLMSNYIKQMVARRETAVLHSHDYESFGVTNKDFESPVFEHYKDQSPVSKLFSKIMPKRFVPDDPMFAFIILGALGAGLAPVL